jgi:TetR/AcrR family transcriptional repressor of lmrAB and yxaGH operons
MAPPPKHRDKIVRSAAELFRRQGYAATGTNDIVALSGAPKGSLYHYFPDGKTQIAEEAVAYAGGRVTATLTGLIAEAGDPASALRAYGRMLVGWLEKSGYRDGCPIATTLLEIAPDADGVAAAGRTAFANWAGIFREALAARGVPAARAGRLGNFAVTALEGGLVQARVERGGQSILAAVDEVADLFAAAISAGRPA